MDNAKVAAALLTMAVLLAIHRYVIGKARTGRVQTATEAWFGKFVHECSSRRTFTALDLQAASLTWDGEEHITGSIAFITVCVNCSETVSNTLPKILALPFETSMVMITCETPSSTPMEFSGVRASANVLMITLDCDETMPGMRLPYGSAYNLAMVATNSEWMFVFHSENPPDTWPIRVHHDATHNQFWATLGRTMSHTDMRAILVRREHLMHSGGFDERVYAHDASIGNLCKRLAARNIYSRRLFPDRMFAPVTHSSNSSENFSIDDADRLLPAPVSEHISEMVVLKLGMWANKTQRENRSLFLATSCMRAVCRLILVRRAPDTSTLAQGSTLARAQYVACGRYLHDTCNIPWSLMQHVDHKARVHLTQASKRLGTWSVLLLHVRNGLGNRLRALGSGLAYARATNRLTVVTWPVDAHCGARFEYLFDAPRDADAAAMAVVTADEAETGDTRDGLRDAAWLTWTSYVVTDGTSQTRILRHPARNVRVAASAELRTEPPRLGGWGAANAELRLLQPVRAVRQAAEQARARLDVSVCMHVRHTPLSGDVHDVKDAQQTYGATEAGVLSFWRAASTPRRFADEARRVLAMRTGLRDVFVAADDVRWVHDVRTLLPGVAVWQLPALRDVDRDACEGGRGAVCVRHALGELECLARCRVVLGSMWSSFSEAARRLGARDVRLAGVDFARVDAAHVNVSADVRREVARTMHAKAQHKLRRQLKHRS